MDRRRLFDQSVLRQIEYPEHDQQRLYLPGRCRINRQLHKAGRLHPTGGPDDYSAATAAPEDPAARNGAVLDMMRYWDPINICVAGTDGLRQYAERLIPREPREDDDAYNRRIFHATLPPFCSVLQVKQRAQFLRRGIHPEGGDEALLEGMGN